MPEHQESPEITELRTALAKATEELAKAKELVRDDMRRNIVRTELLIETTQQRDDLRALLNIASAPDTPCTSDEWLTNCPKSVRDLANRIKAEYAPPVPLTAAQKQEMADYHDIEIAQAECLIEAVERHHRIRNEVTAPGEAPAPNPDATLIDLIDVGLDPAVPAVLKAYAAACATLGVDGEVVVTKNQAGQILAVTRQDEEGVILKTISESAGIGTPSMYTGFRVGGRCGKHPLNIIPCEECGKAYDMRRKGICPECEGQGEQGGQFSGGYWKCEACDGTGKVDVKGDVPAVAVPPAETTGQPTATRITSDQVGTFVDSVAGKVRTPAAVAGRLLEEVVELGLAAGLNAGQLMAHVADALHNQALKDSARQGATAFPSQIRAAPAELPEECADVGLMLKDLCYVAGVDLDAQEVEKHNKFVKKTFLVSPSGTVYAVKPHVTTPEGK